ncbi:hypothetical protein FOZ62_030075 [Perkinsus olseni]|uniref:Uncharacterized protein n=1 Tax=Perkinsus olseni TaxID=32597 RepID=A0A7J6PWI7_PEROL|nr:hypothetical protein FOZ62_030075 [Perkinsus olseni]
MKRKRSRAFLAVCALLRVGRGDDDDASTTVTNVTASIPSPEMQQQQQQRQLRRLATVTSSFSQLGIATEIRLNGETTAATSSTKLHSGVPITSVELYLGTGNTWNPTSARLNIVDGSVTTADAWAGACAAGSSHRSDNYVNSPWSEATGMPSAAAASSPSLVAQPTSVSSEGLLNFRMGGEFKVCYSDTGTFAALHGDGVREGYVFLQAAEP